MVKKSILTVFLGLLMGGCYTQFVAVNRTPAPEDQIETQIITRADSTKDTIKVVRKIDTIVTRDKEVCIWERDFLGYPRLRCYSTLYSRDWYVYNNAPWWYRDDPYWYDYDRCPRYYYYDKTCGSCRYYQDDPYYYYPQNRNNYSKKESTPPPKDRSFGSAPSSSIPRSSGGAAYMGTSNTQSGSSAPTVRRRIVENPQVPSAELGKNQTDVAPAPMQNSVQPSAPALLPQRSSGADSSGVRQRVRAERNRSF